MAYVLANGDFKNDTHAITAQTRFNNRVEVCIYTADTIATCPDVNDLSVFVGFISGVTDDATTLEAAKNSINPIFNQTNRLWIKDSDYFGEDYRPCPPESSCTISFPATFFFNVLFKRVIFPSFFLERREDNTEKIVPDQAKGLTIVGDRLIEYQRARIPEKYPPFPPNLLILHD